MTGRASIRVLGFAALLVFAFVVGFATPADAADGPKWGTLVSQPGHARDEASAGVTQAMVELDWSQIEPRQGQWNDDALARYKDEVLAHRAAGRQVTIGLGTHFVPDWTFGAFRSSRGVDEHGNRCSMLNSVYSYDVRQGIRRYEKHVMRYIGRENIDAVRVTSGGNGELMFSDDSYCAFGHIGIGSLRRSQPDKGQPGTNASTAQHKAWADWYVKSLADAANFQIGELRNRAPRYYGHIELIMPGSGVRPSAFDYAAQQGLPDGLLGLGVAWDRVAHHVHRQWRISVHQSGVGDGTDGNRGCQPGDVGKAIDDPALDSWSSTRWIAKVGDRWGYEVTGENPGYGDSVSTSTYNDPNGLVEDATGLAKSCDLRVFYWAHDHNLWDGSGLAFRNYANHL